MNFPSQFYDPVNPFEKLIVTHSQFANRLELRFKTFMQNVEYILAKDYLQENTF